MKKKIILLLALAASTLGACSGGSKDGKLEIQFWGWGDDSEVEVFKGLTDYYNANNTDNVRIVYTQKPSDTYSSLMEQVLSGRKAPDIFYVGDGDFKRWCSKDLNFLRNIDDWVKESKVIDMNDMWKEGIKRYKYNPETRSQTDSDPIYCLPKDIGPSVIYYNKDAFKQSGITIISKEEKDCTDAEKHGFNLDTMTFNNRIAMTTEEELQLSRLLTKGITPTALCDYGYYTEWWFQYVWSVYGDCLAKGEDGYYKWTLGDTVAKKDPNGKLMNKTPREMFEYFVNLSVKEKVSPKPNTISGMGKINYFINQKVAMMVGIRAQTYTFRKECDFDWDVAPLTREKDGRLAGHSGSMGFGIWSKTSEEKAKAAFKFMEYLSGPEGQTKQAETGFNIPNQISISKTDVFLQKDKKPANSQVFVDAAAYQTVGDWGYLEDSAWINVWAPTLNGAVLNGEMSIDQFFEKLTDPTNAVLQAYGK